MLFNVKLNRYSSVYHHYYCYYYYYNHLVPSSESDQDEEGSEVIVIGDSDHLVPSNCGSTVSSSQLSSNENLLTTRSSLNHKHRWSLSLCPSTTFSIMSNLWFFRYPGRLRSPSTSSRRSSTTRHQTMTDCLNLTQLRTPSIASTTSTSSRHTLNRSSFQTDISRREDTTISDSFAKFSSSSYIPPLRRRTLPPESTLKSTDSYDNLAFTPRFVHTNILMRNRNRKKIKTFLPRFQQ